MLEIYDFLDHIKGTVACRIENTQNKLQGSGWMIREITRFNVTICKFARESLGSYKAYHRDVRGKHNQGWGVGTLNIRLRLRLRLL